MLGGASGPGGSSRLRPCHHAVPTRVELDARASSPPQRAEQLLDHGLKDRRYALSPRTTLPASLSTDLCHPLTCKACTKQTC